MLKQVVLDDRDGKWTVRVRGGKILTFPQRVEYGDDRPSLWIEESEFTHDIRLLRGSVEAIDIDNPVSLRLRPYEDKQC